MVLPDLKAALTCMETLGLTVSQKVSGWVILLFGWMTGEELSQPVMGLFSFFFPW